MTVLGEPTHIKKIERTIEQIQPIIKVLSCRLVANLTAKGTASILPIDMQPQNMLEQ